MTEKEKWISNEDNAFNCDECPFNIGYNVEGHDLMYPCYSTLCAVEEYEPDD